MVAQTHLNNTLNPYYETMREVSPGDLDLTVYISF